MEMQPPRHLTVYDVEEDDVYQIIVLNPPNRSKSYLTTASLRKAIIEFNRLVDESTAKAVVFRSGPRVSPENYREPRDQVTMLTRVRNRPRPQRLRKALAAAARDLNSFYATKARGLHLAVCEDDTISIQAVADGPTRWPHHQLGHVFVDSAKPPKIVFTTNMPMFREQDGQFLFLDEDIERIAWAVRELGKRVQAMNPLGEEDQ